MSLVALEVLDAMIRDTAERANTAATAISGFDAIGAGAGVGIRLRALTDARDAIVTDGLRRIERESQP